jgi:hypothetical protein
VLEGERERWGREGREREVRSVYYHLHLTDMNIKLQKCGFD